MSESLFYKRARLQDDLADLNESDCALKAKNRYFWLVLATGGIALWFSRDEVGLLYGADVAFAAVMLIAGVAGIYSNNLTLKRNADLRARETAELAALHARAGDLILSRTPARASWIVSPRQQSPRVRTHAP